MVEIGRYDIFIPMTNVAKVACSIDAHLLARVESVRKRTGESRSAFISRALRMLTEESARASAVARYVEAYREYPESSDEVQAARRSARRALSQIAWEDR
jgi:metal-responsive CopG/Arc/MetJ family transcriptional regulator